MTMPARSGCMTAIACLALFGCATLTTADKAGVALCELWQSTHPPASTPTTVGQVTCDAIEVTAPWVQAAELAAAKPSGQAAVDALAVHPPLSAAASAALVMPCVDVPKPPDPRDPDGPQSRIDRRLFPPIVVAAPHEGE